MNRIILTILIGLFLVTQNVQASGEHQIEKDKRVLSAIGFQDLPVEITARILNEASEEILQKLIEYSPVSSKFRIAVHYALENLPTRVPEVWIKGRNKGKLLQIKYPMVHIFSPETLLQKHCLIGKMDNLATLGIHDLPLEFDVREISGLSKLKELTLSGSLDGHRRFKLANIQEIGHLRGLIYLDLSQTTAGPDITFISELQSIQILYLVNTFIYDVSPLRLLTSLEALNLCNNSVRSIKELESLTNLRFLDLSITWIDNIDALNSMTNLQTLYLNRTELSDLSPLKDLSRLRKLEIYNTLVEDISALKDNTNLKIEGYKGAWKCN